MARGCLIQESLADETVVGSVDVRREDRVEIAGPGEGQPAVWTLLWFEVADEGADELANVLSRSLKATGGWYCDYTTEDGWKYVVFANRVFRYPTGDETLRKEAENHARSVGVPEDQLDWAEEIPDPWPP